MTEKELEGAFQWIKSELTRLEKKHMQLKDVVDDLQIKKTDVVINLDAKAEILKQLKSDIKYRISVEENEYSRTIKSIEDSRIFVATLEDIFNQLDYL